MNYEKAVLNLDNINQFKTWISLNLHSISWEGRNLESFNHFWNELFPKELEINVYFENLAIAKSLATQGPVISWIDWLEKKLIVYLFIFKNMQIQKLSEASNLDSSSLSLTIRNFFVDQFPHLEEEINNKLQISNVLSEGNKVTFLELKNMFSDPEMIVGATEDEVMTDLEVTLYDDWKVIYNEFCIKPQNHLQENILKERSLLKRNFKFLNEIIILFVLGALFIFLVKVGNKTYEDYLVEKISLFSPNFFWLDKNVSFKGSAIIPPNQIAEERINELEQLENKKVFDDVASSTRFEVESDVVLTSVDTLPKDFSAATFEQSNYEEIRKGGYRNNRYGRRKAYRVMMASVDPLEVKEKVIKMISSYGIKQVDNVKPGTQIPGGIYFNLYVPRENLKTFLQEVSKFEMKSTILESKTVFGGPAGMDKVFVWVKSI